jgi:hypothetical protein
MKVMSKSPSRHVVTLQGIWDLSEQIYIFVSSAVIPMYQPSTNASVWFRLSRKSGKTLI